MHEKIVAFRYDRYKAQLVRLIASKNLIEVDGELRPARVSDVLRGILDAWLYDHAEEYFPQLIKDFSLQGVQNPAVDMMKEWIKNAEDAERELREMSPEERKREGLILPEEKEEK